MSFKEIFVPAAAASLMVVCATALVLGCSAAYAAAPDSVYACLQEGHHSAKPPIVPVPFDIKECTSFTGGVTARDVGVKWCDAAAKSQIFPWDPPPTVTRMSTCPAGAKTLCSVPTPGGEVVVHRYNYLISRDGIDKMQQRCETAPPGMPRGKFERF